MNHINLTFILSISKLTNEHFKIKNEIDPQCFLPLAKTLCSLLTLLKKTSNLRKAHVTRDSSGPATLAISVDLQQ